MSDVQPKPFRFSFPILLVWTVVYIDVMAIMVGAALRQMGIQ